MDRADQIGVVARIHEENKRFYSTIDGRALLRGLDLTFDEQWLYIFELIQNALDAGARTVSIGGDEARFIFQHNGTEEIEPCHVEGMSKLFRSTRGAASVGFMGIGLKSVFKRFRTLRVSGWGWGFRFHIEMVEGTTFHDKQPEMIGAVLPVWDEAATPPDTGFTTRFELSNPFGSARTITADLDHLVSDDGSVLAALAWRGLRQLHLPDRLWSLEPRGAFGAKTITARSGERSLHWCIFSYPYSPSSEAIARFLEVRRLRPTDGEEHAFNEAVRREREVVGIVPVDERGIPCPPPVGRVYATLPTQATLPFCFHLNADWLLTISRTGLRELEDNAWQREIVAGAAHVISQFLQWLTTNHSDPAALATGYSIFSPLTPENTTTLSRSFALDNWRNLLANLLADSPDVPAWAGGTLTMCRPGEVVALPEELSQVFANRVERRPDLLFGGPVLATRALSPTGRSFFEWLGLLKSLSPAEAASIVRDRISGWWSILPGEDSARFDVLFELWAALGALERVDPAWRQLPCVPTDSGGWITAPEALFLDGGPSPEESLGPEVLAFLAPGLPPTDCRVPDQLLRILRTGDTRGRTPFRPVAQGWIESHARKVELGDVVATVVQEASSRQPTQTEALIQLSQWARQHRRPGLLTHAVVARPEGGHSIIPIQEALVAEPYVPDPGPRQALHSGCPRISSAYVETDPFGGEVGEWRSFFEQRDARGPLRIVPVIQTVNAYQKDRAREFLGADDIPDANWRGYELTDFHFDPPIGEPHAPYVASLLSERTAAVRELALRRLSSHYHRPYQRRGPNVAAWLRDLQELRWVPGNDGQFHTIDEVLLRQDDQREDAPIAMIPETLGKTLTDAGIIFGRKVPTLPAVRRLSRLGNQLPTSELATLLREAFIQVGTDEEEHRRLKEILARLTVPTADGRTRVPLHRIVKGRGGLGGWVVSLDELHPELRAAVEAPEVPFSFDNGPTGLHAIEFLEYTWQRAAANEAGLANQVRQILPSAYSIVLRDLENPEVVAQWREARKQAWVFADREWVTVASEPKVAYNDLHDQHLHSLITSPPPLVTPGHLGDTEEERLQVADLLGLRRLSAELTVSVNSVRTQTQPDWANRFEWLQDLLLAVRSEDDTDQTQRLTLEPAARIELTVNGHVHRVNAYLDGNRLLVAGIPDIFEDEAATALVHHFRLGRRGDMAARLATLVAALGDEAAFLRKAENFLGIFQLPFRPVWLISSTIGPEQDKTATEKVSSATDKDSLAVPTGGGLTPVDKSQEHRDKSDHAPPSVSSPVEKKPEESSTERTTGGGLPSNTLGREIARLQSSISKLLKGEIEPASGSGQPPTEFVSTGGQTGEEVETGDESLGDESYRRAAMEYEKRHGRTAQEGAASQPGWDIRSTSGNQTRFIEVKGKGMEWTGEEVVTISRAQARQAMRHPEETSDVSWWLYVVEKVGPGRFRVLPIENPVARAAGWMLRGELWRQSAEAEEVDIHE
jgi:hypothetical protein